MGLAVWGWIVLTAFLAYGIAFLLASIRRVPTGKIGVVPGIGGPRRVLGEGLHVVFPLGPRLLLIPKGPERIMGSVVGAQTKDGWRLDAWVQLYATVSDEQAAAISEGDWRTVTLDSALAAVRLAIERSDAADLRPSPHALDEGARDEANALAGRAGVKVDWLRVTVKWPTATPPAHPPPSDALRNRDGPFGEVARSPFAAYGGHAGEGRPVPPPPPPPPREPVPPALP